MGISNQLKAISNGFEIVASFPEFKSTPIVIGESDPEGCAAVLRALSQNGYRNGTMYSSYTAAQLARTYELADLHGVNLMGSVTWAFEFEDQPYFDGFRDLATNGIDKPVLNVFRMLGMMTGKTGSERLAVESSGALKLETIRDRSVRANPEINALASRQASEVSVMVWNYHDDDLPAPASENRIGHQRIAKQNLACSIIELMPTTAMRMKPGSVWDRRNSQPQHNTGNWNAPSN